MKVLSHLLADGAFDQERPLVRLRSQKKRNSFSFDLKSATDRWPLSVIYTFMSCMWGSTLASSIVNSSLCLNTFLIIPPMRGKEGSCLCSLSPCPGINTLSNILCFGISARSSLRMNSSANSLSSKLPRFKWIPLGHPLAA
ncbi:hypothetical protein R3W88_024366 [Solanum pinnatisectum]|uniref:Uncharacterized protein n=1 Tax=Solanum pinnatisectum TaxID=50273 RepID=A0AAV9M015_9SOLN|nr:hypothetical protein R3W88_024366 [Solanum pinnatisectum]